MERVVSGPQPPAWLVHELQHRTVLFLNHVLMQEREAMERLARQSGRSAHVQWRNYFMTLLLTPAGLLELAPEGTMPDLRLEVSDSSPLQLARSALAGERPAIRIEGDVQLAADINWVVDHLRWDVEEDLSRLVGDAPARALAAVAERIAAALRRFVGARMGAAGDAGGLPAQAPGQACGSDRSPP
ncbi:hypothetical protein MASR1M59_11420 [Melaminivora sp.]